MPPAASKPASAPFEDDLRSTAGAVREAIVDLMASAGADPNRPRELARQLGLRTGLSWKICKVVQETDLYAAVPHIPGAPGFKLVFEAFEKSGAPEPAVAAARNASRAFQRMVDTHSGDRQTLMTMLGQIAPERTNAQLEADRKLGFVGNSSTWGVQERLTLGTQIVAPSRETPGMVDIAGLVGHCDVRRLRRSAGWVLLKSLSYNDDGSLREDAHIPIDPTVEQGNGLPLLRDYCEALPEIREISIPSGRRFELSEGPVGHTAAFTCVFGSFDRQFASGYRDERNRFGEHPILVHTPSELLIADLFVHRDLAFELPPEPLLYSCLFGGVDATWPPREADRMPLTVPVHDLGRPASAATPHVPRYPQMLKLVYDRLGWDQQDFHGYRLLMPYPPIPTALVLRYGLAERG
jgi:hypothetical protein